MGGRPMTDIRVSRDDRLVVVTLDRPAVHNAMTLAMWQELARIFTGLAGDASLGAVILTGAGGHFCAGADIGEFGTKRSDAAQGAVYADAVDAATEAIHTLPRPVIAAIDGFCLGGGCGLALACDFRFATAEARIGITAARLSIIYGLKGTRYLLDTVGLVQAKRVLFSAERIPAEEALRIGLVDRIVPGPALDGARSYAAELGNNAPLTIAAAKATLNGLVAGTITDEAVTRLQQQALASFDYAEGRLAFKEKRPPRFRGA